MFEKPLSAKIEMSPPVALRRRRWRIGIPFSPELEAGFQQEMDRMRRRHDRRIGIAAMIIYSLFAINDRIMLPDTYMQAWAIRFLLVVPVMAVCTFGMERVRSTVSREILLSAMIVLCALSVAWIGDLSSTQQEHANRYHSGISLIMLFGNIVLNLRFRSAFASSVIIAAVYAVGLTHLHAIPPEVRIHNWLVFAGFAVISLIANFRMDQDQRRAYLARAREQQRNEELSNAVERLGRLSSEDALTGIPNRREFDRRLALEWGRARRETQPLAILLIDVDFFKNYNDYYGHPAGDVCLRQVATMLNTVPQRSSDLVARLGGEEFGVLLPATTIDDAALLAESMRKAVLDLHLPHPDSTAAPVVSVSVGVAAMVPTMQDEPAELLAAADAALYSAKKNGRNRVVTYTR